MRGVYTEASAEPAGLSDDHLGKAELIESLPECVRLQMTSNLSTSATR